MLKLDFSWVEGDGNSISKTSCRFCNTLKSGFHKCMLAFSRFRRGVTIWSAPSRQLSGSILGCLMSSSTLMDTLFPIAILLMVSALLGFSGSRTHVFSSISSRTRQNSARDSRTSRNWAWIWPRELWERERGQEAKSGQFFSWIGVLTGNLGTPFLNLIRDLRGLKLRFLKENH